VLATEATALAHGRAAAEDAAETARKLFTEGVAAEGLPTEIIPASEFGEGIAAFALLARLKLAASNGEARRLIRGGGVRLDDVVITDEAHLITPKPEQKLSVGKKQHVLVKLG
jgi:tyrosyl-tRNA synthetase